MATSPFVSNVLQRAPGMSFFQLCRLIEQHAPGSARLGSSGDVVRFHPRPSMGFPPGELAAAPRIDGLPAQPPVVHTTFFGLYGVDAAIPSHFIDDIVLRREGYEAVMGFIDPFNHRIVTMMYRAWWKYRYPIGFEAGGTDDISRHLLCLGGMGHGAKPERAGVTAPRALAMIGLLQQRTRTAAGIASVVRIAAPGFAVAVEEFHAEWVSVPDGQRLHSATGAVGQSTGGLGEGVLLGRRILCRHRSVVATLRPMPEADTQAMFPGGDMHTDVLGMLRLYVGMKVDVVLRLTTPASSLPPSHLGLKGACLGRLANLRRSSMRSVNVPLGRYHALQSRRMPA